MCRCVHAYEREREILCWEVMYTCVEPEKDIVCPDLSLSVLFLRTPKMGSHPKPEALRFNKPRQYACGHILLIMWVLGCPNSGPWPCGANTLTHCTISAALWSS